MDWKKEEKVKMGSQKQTISQIKKIVKDRMPDARIVLFGSRARGDCDARSDYDLLIVNTEAKA